MKPSDKLVMFVAREEGFSAVPYDDVGGNATIGYGHLMHLGPVREAEAREYRHAPLSKAQALTLLRSDIEVAAADVTGVLRPRSPLKQHEFDALCSWVFNLGIKQTHDSTLARHLRAGFYAAVPVEMMRWIYSDSKALRPLLERRRREAYLWIDGQYGELPEVDR